MVDIYYRQKDFGEGINILCPYAIDMLPDDMIFGHYLARFYMEDAKQDLAIDELEYILEKQPDNYDAYYDLAKVYFEFGNYDSAIENLENILEYLKKITNLSIIILGKRIKQMMKLIKLFQTFKKQLQQIIQISACL